MKRMVGRLVGAISSLSGRSLSARAQRWLLALALVVFVVGGFLAWRGLGVEISDLRWGYILGAALIGVPLTAIANALEFSLSVRMVGAEPSFLPSLRVSVLSTAANLLPLPGGPAVRIEALRRLGGGYRAAISSTVLLALFWLGLASLAAGGLLIPSQENPVVSWSFLVAGLVSLGVGWMLHLGIDHGAAGHVRSLIQIFLVEAGLVAVSALRLYLLLFALNVAPDFRDGLVLAVSGVIAAAVGIFPGGLGLREAIGAALAPLVGLGPSVGFAVTALDRVMGMVLYAPLTAWLLMTKKDSAGWVADMSPDSEQKRPS